MRQNRKKINKLLQEEEEEVVDFRESIMPEDFQEDL